MTTMKDAPETPHAEVFLFQKGSSESKPIGKRTPQDEDPRKAKHDPKTPWPVRKGGLALVDRPSPSPSRRRTTRPAPEWRDNPLSWCRQGLAAGYGAA